MVGKMSRYWPYASENPHSVTKNLSATGGRKSQYSVPVHIPFEVYAHPFCNHATSESELN